MEKRISLGTGTRNCIELVIKERTGKHWEALTETKGFAISISGNVRIPYFECAGQCLNEIEELYKDGTLKKNKEKVLRIIELWREWHLNDLHAGTKKQTEYLNTVEYDGYSEACEKLKEAGLYEDNGYRYGHGWLFNPAPIEVVQELVELFN